MEAAIPTTKRHDPVNIIKVSARSRSTAVAGAIAGVVRERGRAEVQSIGAGAVNQSIKAVAIAHGYLKEDEIDVVVIVSDWLMTGKKGDELLIDVHEKKPKTVKIMLTGQADPEAIERAKQQANLHACLSKPWTKEKLIETIKAGLETL